MNDMEVSQQVQQMVQFIRQEAEEKANEISVSAEEEFNIEKLQIVEAEKKKIRQEFERKEKQVEVRRKIEYSTQLNASRLKLLQAQDDLVRKMKEAAENQLRKEAAEKQLQMVGSSDNEDYPKLLEALIIQGLLRLKEHSTQLRCREQDLEIVQSVIGSTKQAYAEKLNVDVPEVFVDEEHFLPGPPGSSNHGSSCTGGVVLATKDGRIVLENTLDARLEVVFKQQLPEIFW
ncbi:V-type proton ATPase subunit E isoform X2 [Physcomitrium patens]|uniref:Uncharacterized protein n=1 Tax=Physcomitrium patens TaxID=3218 RepID=A0A7I4ARW5_PHYPA|nr:V-type proton ATPase subunit E-like isoform X2 [Physcomitrium patens]|eukprot:XP_024394403.1 V-type proton ATPase subunit E-like isoform X2 [Physcomitrella patens]